MIRFGHRRDVSAVAVPCVTPARLGFCTDTILTAGGVSDWEVKGLFCFKGRCFNLPWASVSALLQLFRGPAQNDGGLEVAEEVLVFSMGLGIVITLTMVFEASGDKGRYAGGTSSGRLYFSLLLSRMSKTVPISAISTI